MTGTGARVAITGASGYIGRALVRMALRDGLEVTALARRRPPWLEAMPVRFGPFDIAGRLDPEALAGAGAVIHLAADTRDEAQIDDLTENAEVAAAVALARSAADRGARFVFVSSQTARPGAPTRYGRVKWRIERAVEDAGGVIVRPGLVFGGPREAGLFGRLCDLVRRLPALPALLPAPRVQPVHVDDVCRALLRVALAPDLGATAYNVALHDGVSFTRFLGAIARERLRTRRPFVPVPLFVVAALARVARRVPAIPDAGADRLVSLAALEPMDTAASLRALDLALTPLADGMHPSGSGRRRRLAREGRLLLGHVLGAPPSVGLAVRYVRAIEALEDGVPMDLPPWPWRMPGLLFGLAEAAAAPGADGSPLGRRLGMAFAIAEASREGAPRFLALRRTPRAAALLRLSAVLLAEIPFLAVRAMTGARRRHRAD